MSGHSKMSQRLQRLNTRVRRRWRWAGENPLFWWNLALVGGVAAILWTWPSNGASDFWLRVLGMALQIIGVLAVWHDLTSAARQFGRDGIMLRTWRWLKAGFSNRTITMEGSFHVSCDMSARMKRRRQFDSTAPLDERVKALEVNFGYLDEDLGELEQGVDRQKEEWTKAVKDEAASREREITGVKESIESAVAGNYPILLFGAWWLFVGIVIASLAPEIALAAAGRWEELLPRI